MTISRDEEWVQIAYLDKQEQIRFTRQFLTIMGELGWEAKAFVGHLLGLWYDPFEHMLDYDSGDVKFTRDQPGEFDVLNPLTEPQDVVGYWAETWSENSVFYKPSHEAGIGLRLDVEWYRDVLRAKLVPLRLPERLLVLYKENFLDELRALGYDLDGTQRSS
jgi:hypothetical protein